jgi:hypothetical protein
MIFQTRQAAMTVRTAFVYQSTMLILSLRGARMSAAAQYRRIRRILEWDAESLRNPA